METLLRIVGALFFVALAVFLGGLIGGAIGNAWGIIAAFLIGVMGGGLAFLTIGPVIFKDF